MPDDADFVKKICAPYICKKDDKMEPKQTLNNIKFAGMFRAGAVNLCSHKQTINISHITGRLICLN